MLTELQREELRDKIYALLDQVGMKVDHEKMEQILLSNGCRKSASGRILMSRAVIDRFTEAQKKDQAADSIMGISVIGWAGARKQRRSSRGEFIRPRSTADRRSITIILLTSLVRWRRISSSLR
jgi:hypothetical protein